MKRRSSGAPPNGVTVAVITGCVTATKSIGSDSPGPAYWNVSGLCGVIVRAW